MPLSRRITVINGVVFAVGTALLALSPATVSARPLLSELVVLVVGLAVMVTANGLLVRGTLQPLERLVRELEALRSTEPLGRLSPADHGIAGRIGAAVNDLVSRIDAGQRSGRLSTLAGQEAERARIAQELHDGVGQSLTALLLQLRALSEEPGAASGERLTEVREAARASLDEVREVARRLRPHVLEDLGLRSALAALTTDLFARGDTHVTRGIAPGLPQLDDATELVVYRVAQEALTNIARHAGAQTVELTLGRRGAALVLRVADDGCGIAPGADGTGLRGMRERAALVGAELSVRRRDGGGTVVELAVPGLP